MESMTGFGSASARSTDFTVEISVKSVNSRFLDVKFYTPPFYIPLELELNRLISKHCQRGHFVVHIDRCPQKPLTDISLKWNKQQSRKWKQLYSRLAREMKFQNNLTAKDIIDRKGVIQIIEKSKSLGQQEKNTVKRAFQKALQSCVRERKREGLSLKKDILSHLKSINSFIQKISSLNKKQKDTYIKRKEDHIKQNKKDLSMEVQKFDIHEELTRVKEHLRHFKKMLSGSAPVGRKLDFYVQEILRELNTMGAKSYFAELTLTVVEGKFILEKIKEQIQNLE